MARSPEVRTPQREASRSPENSTPNTHWPVLVTASEQRAGALVTGTETGHWRP